MTSSFLRQLSGLFAGSLLAVSLHAQVVDTTPTWDGLNMVAPLGEPDTGTYGQTFRAPAGFTQLTDFTFWLQSSAGPDGVDFAAYVMEWDTALGRATGPILFQSAQQILPYPNFAVTPFVFNTGALALDASKQYIAFMSASNFFDSSPGTASVGYVGADVYADGGFFFFNNKSNFGALTSSTWETFVGSGIHDLAFRANFSVSGPPSAVPEPSTYGLIGAAALVGLIAIRRRRKSAA